MVQSDTENLKIAMESEKSSDAAAPQLSADKLISEALRRNETRRPHAPRFVPQTDSEMRAYLAQERTRWEGLVQSRGKTTIGNLLKYAAWEAELREVGNARKIFERALSIDPYAAHVYLRYADMEISFKQVNHAREILGRATRLLPAEERLWLKRIFVEEALSGNLSEIFQQWISASPTSQLPFQQYFRFLRRAKDVEKSREVHALFCENFRQISDPFIAFANFEEAQGNVAAARQIFERVARSEISDAALFVAFGEFEERHGNFPRVLEMALRNFPTNAQVLDCMKKISKRLGIFSDQLATIDRIEKISDLPSVESLFELVRAKLEISDHAGLEQLFATGLEKFVPEISGKNFQTRRLVFFVLMAATWHVRRGDASLATKFLVDFLEACLSKNVVSNKILKFLAEISDNLSLLRRLYGAALGKAPTKASVYRSYIELEISAGEISRCREIYSRYVQRVATARPWVEFAEFEIRQGERTRAQALVEGAWKLGFVEVWKLWLEISDSSLAVIGKIVASPDVPLEALDFLVKKKFKPEVRASLAEKFPSHSDFRVGLVEAALKAAKDERRANLLKLLLQVAMEISDPALVEKTKKRQPRRVNGQWEFPDDVEKKAKLLDFAKKFKSS